MPEFTWPDRRTGLHAKVRGGAGVQRGVAADPPLAEGLRGAGAPLVNGSQGEAPTIIPPKGGLDSYPLYPAVILTILILTGSFNRRFYLFIMHHIILINKAQNS